MPNTFGDETKTLFLKSEEEKLSQEFEAGAALKKGQAVKLDTDGTILPVVTADLLEVHIGVCLHDAAIGELATVALRGHMIICARSSAALSAGMVKFASYDSVNNRSKYATAATTTSHGWSLDAAVGADEDIRVLLPD